MITNEQEIKDALSIEEVIGHFLELKPDGSNLKALCPFHNENTPSFKVNPNKGIYKCFGCGAGGGPVNFLMEHEGMEYPQALEWIADKAGVRIDYDDEKDHNEMKLRRQHRKALQASLNQLTNEAHQGAPAPDVLSSFLGGRSWSDETIKTFRLFYAPEGWCRKSEVKNNHLQELGLLKPGQNGIYELFRDRLMFPISDPQGNVRGYGGRKRADNTNPKVPKYLNSSDSIIYKKEDLLYGLEQAMQSIRKKGFAYLVEGYTDVITLYDHDIKNAVATCGTALTERQCQLLKRFTDKVLILRDGDEPGREAAERDIRQCVKAGLQPRVIFLTDDMDPDDFVREKGGDELKVYSDENNQDGILYLVEKGYDKDDPYSVSMTKKMAVNLLADMKDEALQQAYISSINDVLKGNNLSELRSMLKDELARRLDEGESDLTDKQQRDVMKYGLYEHKNCYYVSYDRTAKGNCISNFVIKPVMLIVGSEKSRRMVEVINEHGHKFSAPIDSDAFVELNAFKKTVEAQGNYLFEGETKEFLKVKKKLYESMPPCYPIETMGYHSAGFYAWANGISKKDGTFNESDEYGIVSHKDKKYYLPAFSKAEQREGLEDDGFEDLRNFVLVKGEAPPFHEWADKMQKVHGDSGVIAVNWSLAALFRDHILKELKGFPLLFLFGPPQSGKSYLSWSVSALFGKPSHPFVLTKGTPVGFSRRMSQVRNGVMWCDEFGMDLIQKIIDGLKGVWDGSGYERGVKSTDNRTDRVKPLSACLVSGQHLPNQDPALFTRCICLEFEKKAYTSEEEARGDELKALEESGVLSQITAYIQKFRGKIKDQFTREYSAIRSKIRSAVNIRQLDPRHIINYGVPLTVMSILKREGVQFPYSFEEAMKISVGLIEEQARKQIHEDEVGQWWQIFEHLANANPPLIEKGKDYIVKEKEELRGLIDPKTREDIHLQFDKPQKVLFVNFSNSHPLYEKYMRTNKGVKGLGKSALQTYLANSQNCLGYKRSCRFESVKTAYAFKIGFGEDSLGLTWLMSDDQFGEDIEEMEERSAQFGGPGYKSTGDIKREQKEEEKEMRDNRPDPDDPGDELPF